MKRNENKWRNIRLSQVGSDDSENERLKALIKNLCKEIHYKAMPQAAAEFINRNIKGLLLEPILAVVKEYGEYDVIFLADNNEMPDKNCISIVFIDEHVCLLKQRASIPLVDFMEYFQEHGPSYIMDELGHIPKGKQEYVYQKAVDFIRQQLIKGNSYPARHMKE